MASDAIDRRLRGDANKCPSSNIRWIVRPTRDLHECDRCCGRIRDRTSFRIDATHGTRDRNASSTVTRRERVPGALIRPEWFNLVASLLHKDIRPSTPDKTL
jgi:hypothetical protein